MRFIIETDLGHDIDDFLTICHLVAAGHTIDAMTVCPGSSEQIRLANVIRQELNLDFSLYSSKSFTKSENIGVHNELVKKYSVSRPVWHGYADDNMGVCFDEFDGDLLIIGPALALSKQNIEANACTFQGGFCPYSVYDPLVKLQKFIDNPMVPSFNFGGCKNGVANIIYTFKNRPEKLNFVGKNVCHTIELTKNQLVNFQPRCRASELYLELCESYFKKHTSKKLHDPTALVCHLHPEIGIWHKGRPYYNKGCWTTLPGEHNVLVDIDREKLWKHLYSWT